MSAGSRRAAVDDARSAVGARRVAVRSDIAGEWCGCVVLCCSCAAVELGWSVLVGVGSGDARDIYVNRGSEAPSLFVPTATVPGGPGWPRTREDEAQSSTRYTRPRGSQASVVVSSDSRVGMPNAG